MSILEALLLGVVQGLTEFLPISSSGHLLILEEALNLDKTGLTFDVALHLGTLIALLLYFRRDLWRLAKALVVRNNQTKLAWLIVAATVPAAVFGYLLEDAAESSFRSPLLVAVNLSVFGLIMLVAEKYAASYQHKTKLQDTKPSQAMIMGLAQAAAIVPGVSRSGSTITAGLFAGLDRVSATRFSFLLGVPIIAGAALKVLLTGSALSDIGTNWPVFLVGISTAFVTGLAAIRFMLKYLANHSLAIFAYYRFALALLVVIFLAA